MLHLTKVAYGAASLEDMQQWFADRGEEALLTTRYLPKSHVEIVAGGSLFWILKHQLVVRSPILRFAEAEDGKTNIVIAARLILVHPMPKRAHQGWRYLAAADAPLDVAVGDPLAEAMPLGLAGELSRLGLV